MGKRKEATELVRRLLASELISASLITQPCLLNDVVVRQGDDGGAYDKSMAKRSNMAATLAAAADTWSVKVENGRSIARRREEGKQTNRCRKTKRVAA